MTHAGIGQKYGVARATVSKWIRAYKKQENEVNQQNTKVRTIPTKQPKTKSTKSVPTQKVIVQPKLPKPITNKCKQCQIPITHSATKCPTCYQKSTRKTTRPPYTQLMQEIADTSYKAVGKKYGVSDNAVRKWVNTYIKSDPIFQNRKKIDGHYRCEEEGCTNKTTNISLYCLPCMIANRGKNYFHTQKCDICNCFAKTNPCNECRNNSEELIDVPARPTKIRVKKETD